MFQAAQWNEYLRHDALRRAPGLSCIARSLSREEAWAKDRRYIVFMVLMTVAWVAFLVWLAWHQREVLDVPEFRMLAVVSTLILASLPWWRYRQRRNYVDRKIVVEVAADRVIVGTPAGPFSPSYDELRISEILSKATKSSRYFTGIALETPAGRILLDDENYENGTGAAAAILKQCDGLGVPPRDEGVGSSRSAVHAWTVSAASPSPSTFEGDEADR